MRASHVVTTLAAVSAGLTAAAAWQRRTDRRLPAPAAPATASLLSLTPQFDRDGVVLPFVRRVALPPVPDEQPVTPARCGDSGGQTKAGAPCAARATAQGRCHHHRVAA